MGIKERVKKWSWSILKYYPSIYLGGLKNVTRNLKPADLLARFLTLDLPITNQEY
jgi:hypothetical protein